MERSENMSELDKAAYQNILRLAFESKFISEATYQNELDKLQNNEEI